MKRLFNILMLAGVVMLTYSCSETSAPTATQMLPGEWDVAETYVNGQTQGTVDLFTRFILERDGSFVLEDINGIFFAGNWTATNDQLTLNAADGTVFNFTIIFQSYTKMQLLQTISGSNTGDLEIRYLLNNRFDNEDY
ncbi:hypothetical protein [Ekhidna sp.]|uniref:hypothetical protein n=1 Tax=Ekhidna sp. TaxID=2608089 RepID=UPI003296C25D